MLIYIVSTELIMVESISYFCIYVVKNVILGFSVFLSLINSDFGIFWGVKILILIEF